MPVYIYLVDLSLNWTIWFQFLILMRGPLVILIGCIKNIYVNSFFPSRNRLGNSFSAKCFVLNYDQSGFKPRINKLWSES